MIERNYAYHGKVDCNSGGTKRFSGFSSLKSWSPDPGRVYLDVQKAQEENYKDDCTSNNVHIVWFQRI